MEADSRRMLKALEGFEGMNVKLDVTCKLALTLDRTDTVLTLRKAGVVLGL